MSRTYRAERGTRCLVCREVLAEGEMVKPLEIGWAGKQAETGIGHSRCVDELVGTLPVDQVEMDPNPPTWWWAAVGD